MKTSKTEGTRAKHMVNPINVAIGQEYYKELKDGAASQAAFSNLLGKDLLNNNHPIITGIMTKDAAGHALNGWKHSTQHIVTIYGFDFSSPTEGTISYMETGSQGAGTTKHGSQSMDYQSFWPLVAANNVQIVGK